MEADNGKLPIELRKGSVEEVEASVTFAVLLLFPILEGGVERCGGVTEALEIEGSFAAPFRRGETGVALGTFLSAEGFGAVERPAKRTCSGEDERGDPIGETFFSLFDPTATVGTKCETQYRKVRRIASVPLYI